MPDLSRLIDPYPPASLGLPWEQDVVALRRDFHAHPELGFQEHRTAGIVAARLRELGLEVQTGIGVTGVVGTLRGGLPGPMVLARADMDALPIEEANPWKWKSIESGKMHACGHDAHTAMMLSVARLLVERRQEIAGTVKLVFQPAEEGLGGMRRMIEDGLLVPPLPSCALAMHVWSDLPAGTLALRDGPVMACADSFIARIIGRGGHGAIPQQTIDPVVIASQIVMALQTTVSRNINPLQPAVVTVGKVFAGSAFNIIPGEAQLEGTVRSFDEGVRSTLERRCREIVEELPRAFEARGEFTYVRDYPATVNDARVTSLAREAFEEVAGAKNVVEFEPTMGAEDMALVLQKVPGCYFFVGGRNPEIDAVYPHHHPKFNIDERSLTLGARAMVAAISRCLREYS